MGRRQFLMGAAATSAFGLAGGKIAKSFSTAASPDIAEAAEAPASGAIDSTRYRHLMSPLQIGNVVLKNRLFSTNAVVHALQGPENFPAETMRRYSINLAKAGAAIVTCRFTVATMHGIKSQRELENDSAHMSVYHLEEPGVQTYIDQMVEGIRAYGAKACVPLYALTPDQNTLPPGPEHTVEPLSDADAQKIIDKAIRELSYFQNRGFEMTILQMVQYKGDNRQREQFSVKLCREIKKQLGRDFLVAARISMVDSPEGRRRNSVAYTQDEIIASAKQWEGIVDILQLMAGGAYLGFDCGRNDPPPSLQYSQALKESGARITVAPNGGFNDLDKNEQYIKEGKADIIALGRSFICDWEYGKKATEGRGEDVVPCLQCNRCHGPGQGDGPWISVCSVNPKLGIHDAVQLLDRPSVKKKVAVIGGGPAGMKAAITSAERGHEVTLYEKTGYLGGLLRHADYAAFKWPLKAFRDYLVRQVKKSGIKVFMNTAATPDMIKGKGFDAILVALGAMPNVPRIPGADGKNVFDIDAVFGREKEVGKNVVIVGAGAYSVETGIHLAQLGRKVTLLAAGRDLVEPSGPHQLATLQRNFQTTDGCSAITQVVPKSISKGKVTYTDAKGNEKSVKADSVVLYAGLKARQAEAMKFAGLAGQVHLIGECRGNNDGVQKGQRSAFFAASQI
jgi:2,4-dienoyl-CoA reductase-like NADH-dependent reductase (Old Yellow Enzyme family)/thioredoxin reductase